VEDVKLSNSLKGFDDLYKDDGLVIEMVDGRY